MLYKYFYNNFALFDTCADIHPFEFPTKEGALIREKTRCLRTCLGKLTRGIAVVLSST